MLNLLRKSAARKQDARRLYDALVSRSREPVFFTHFAVPDTLDGRFDVLVLHAWLVLAELRGGDAAQALTDMIFSGFDEAMREQGVGDMGIGHKLKAMGNAFYGRMTAYDAAQNQEELASALARNLWRGAAINDRARTLSAYALGARASLKQSLPDKLDFGPLPAI